jgi:raffinose/stachyose/melibiose transport system permease protein
MRLRKLLNPLATIVFALISIFYVSPIIIVLINSFKNKTNISLTPFQLPNYETYIGFENYLAAINDYKFVAAVGWTLIMTVGSVLTILLCTSMFA